MDLVLDLVPPADSQTTATNALEAQANDLLTNPRLGTVRLRSDA